MNAGVTFLEEEGVTLPHSSIASDDSLMRAWDCAAGEFAFEYSSGVVVYVGPRDFDDPEASWELIVETYPGTYGLTEVQALRGLTADSKAEGALGGVEFAKGRLTVVINGDGRIALEDLIVAAESMEFSNADAPAA
jgi:hypothetical protein